MATLFVLTGGDNVVVLLVSLDVGINWDIFELWYDFELLYQSASQTKQVAS